MLGPAPSVHAPDSDDALVHRILAGESALFEHIMRRHNQRVFRAARAIVKDEAEAEDVMQETYTRAFAHLAQFRGEAQLGTWLVRIAVHEAFARVRRQRRLAPLPPDDTVEALSMFDRPTPIDPEHEANNAELRRLLERAIDELPETYRTVFVLRDLHGLSHVEIGQRLNLSAANVKTRIHRARSLLRGRLSEPQTTSRYAVAV